MGEVICVSKNNATTSDAVYEKLEKNEILKKVFVNFCEFTTTNERVGALFQKYNFDINSVGRDEYIDHLSKSGLVEKSKDAIAHYVDALIKCGLIRYVVDEPYYEANPDPTKDNERFEYYKKLGHPNSESKLVITGKMSILGPSTPGSGAYYYLQILKERMEREKDRKRKEEFAQSVHEALDDDIDKIKQLAIETEKKLNEIQKESSQNAVKNIEVLSIFVAIIALFFSNVAGVSNYASIGLRGIILLNVSTVVFVLTLIVFVELLVVRNNLTWKHWSIIVLTYLICFAGIILVYSLKWDFITVIFSQ